MRTNLKSLGQKGLLAAVETPVAQFLCRLQERTVYLEANLEVRAHEQPNVLAGEAALFVKSNVQQPEGHILYGKVDARKLEVDRLQFTVGQFDDIVLVEVL